MQFGIMMRGQFPAKDEVASRFQEMLEQARMAERLGYDRWTMSGVEILSDGCHVIPVSLRVQMAPAS